MKQFKTTCSSKRIEAIIEKMNNIGKARDLHCGVVQACKQVKHRQLSTKLVRHPVQAATKTRQGGYVRVLEGRLR